MWWAHQDSNLGQAGYEPAALTTELWALQQLIADAGEDRRTGPIFSHSAEPVAASDDSVAETDGRTLQHDQLGGFRTSSDLREWLLRGPGTFGPVRI